MGFKCGIVGLPNVGKSTIFNALTSAGAEAANFPFCTKDPNVGMVDVPDPRLNQLVEAFSPQKTIPAVMQFVDIAGLVRGASKGEGLGNQFLTHIRETEAIMHVVRCFDDVDVTHVEETVDPVRDAQLIMMELILKDMSSVESRLARDVKLAKSSGNKDAKARVEVEEKLLEVFNQEKPASAAGLEEEELALISDMHLLTLKPMFFCANVAEDDLEEDNEYVKKIKEFAAQGGYDVLKISGKIESEIAELSGEEKAEFLKDLGLEESGLDQVIRKGQDILGLHTYFTAGEKEVRAWTIPKGAKAPQAAGVIHTDFERGFIRAETLGYSDFLTEGSWNGAKEKGLIRTEGKEYEVVDGDIMHFLFNV
jgi:GTP-binding protein YchF